MRAVDGSVWTNVDVGRGKALKWDVVFGPRPDKCYSKPAKKKLHLSPEVPALLPAI